MAKKNTGSHLKGSQANRQGAKPKTRPSKTPRKPVTIDLEASKVVSKPTASPATEATAKSPEKSHISPATAKPSMKSAVPTVKAATPTIKAATAIRTNAPDKVSDTGKPSANKTSESAKPEPVAARAAQTTKPDAKNKTAQGQNSAIGKKTPTPTVPRANSTGSTGGKILAGIIGGAIALVGAYLLQQTGALPSGSSNNSELQSEISRIDKTLTGLADKQGAGATASPDLKSLIAQIAELQASQKALNGKLEVQGKEIEKTGAAASSLSASIEQVTKTSKNLQQSISSGSAGKNAALSTLDERMKALEGNEASSSNAGSSEVEKLKAQLAELTGKVSKIGSADTSKQDGLLKEVTANIAALSAKLAETTQSNDVAQTATKEKVSTLEGTVGQVQQNLTELDTRIGDIANIAATPQKDERRVARALAVASLKSAIDAGGNFEAALALVASLSSDTTATAALKPFSATGVPGQSVLVSEFAGIADKIIATGTPVKNGSVVSKLLANMRSLVKVKATGVVAGSTPLAIVSRIEDGLKKSDLNAVIKEWELLPDTAKTLSSHWIKSVKARQTANELIENLLNKFVTGVSDAGN